MKVKLKSERKLFKTLSKKAEVLGNEKMAFVKLVEDG